MSITYKESYGRPSKEVFYNSPLEDVYFNSCVGIIVDRNGCAWVADTGNNRILIFDFNSDPAGTLCGVLNENLFKNYKLRFPKEANNLNLPFRLTLHPDSAKKIVYVTDMANHRVIGMNYSKVQNKVYSDASGNTNVFIEKTYGRHGIGQNKIEFNGPNGICALQVSVNGKNDVYLVAADEFAGESTYGRIVIFNEKGDFIRSFGAVNTPDGKSDNFFWPQGIAVDENQYLYIPDPYKKRIIRTDLFGNPAPFASGSYEILNPNFSIPRKVFLKDDKIFIVDNGNTLVFAYDKNGNYCTGTAVYFGPIDMSALDNGKVLVTHAGIPAVVQWELSPAVSLINPVKKAGSFRGTQPATSQEQPQFQAVTMAFKNVGQFVNMDSLMYNAVIPGIPLPFFSQCRIQTCDINYQFPRSYHYPSIIISQGLAFDDETGKYFMTDISGNVIHYYDSEFNYLGFIKPIGEYALVHPKGIFVKNNPFDASGQSLLLIIANTDANNVVILSCNKAIPSVFSGFDVINSESFHGASAVNSFNSPRYAYYSNNNIAVVDQNNNRIAVFYYNNADVKFTYLNEFGTMGYEKNDIFLPSYLYVIGDYYFVLDLINRSIKVFQYDNKKKEYRFVTCYSVDKTPYPQSLGARGGQMWLPASLDLDSATSKIYISDMTLNKVNVYKIAPALLVKISKSKFLQLKNSIRGLWKEMMKNKKRIKQNKNEFQAAYFGHIEKENTKRKDYIASDEYKILQAEYLELLEELKDLIQAKAQPDKMESLQNKIKVNRQKLMVKFPELFNNTV